VVLVITLVAGRRPSLVTRRPAAQRVILDARA
jgi:hypothetical protein